LVICGGKTRKKFDSEAEIIFLHLKNAGMITDNVKVIMEEESRTTTENIKQAKQFLKDVLPIKFEAITTKESVPRFKYLYNKLWPETKGKVYFFSDNKSRRVLKILEKIYYWYAHVDPECRWLKLPVKIFRNGQKISFLTPVRAHSLIPSPLLNRGETNVLNLLYMIYRYIDVSVD